MLFWLQIGFLLLLSWLALLVNHLLLLSGAAWLARRTRSFQPGQPIHRFLILIPAYNEERLLSGLLASLAKMDHPPSFFSVHVVADNCTDQTAAVAQRWGATVHIRTNLEERGKGYALQWLIHKLIQAGDPHDAVVILDADSLVSPNFLQAMSSRLASGERVIQAYYSVRDPGRSLNSAWRYAGFAMVHFLRPLGRMKLGGSVGLKGNGMVFSAEIIQRHEWSASLTEDIEYHMALLLDGEKVAFAPEAIVYGEMPDTLGNSQSQQVRWERGRLQMARRYVPRLVKEAWLEARSRHYQRTFTLLDATVEHLIPPFSILAGISLFCLLINLLLFAAGSNFLPPVSINLTPSVDFLVKTNLLISFWLLSAQLIYLLAGLLLVQAPKNTYRALLLAPFYVVWKIWQYLRMFTKRDQQGWVRTRRNES